MPLNNKQTCNQLLTQRREGHKVSFLAEKVELNSEFSFLLYLSTNQGNINQSVLLFIYSRKMEKRGFNFFPKGIISRSKTQSRPVLEHGFPIPVSTTINVYLNASLYFHIEDWLSVWIWVPPSWLTYPKHIW